MCFVLCTRLCPCLGPLGQISLVPRRPRGPRWPRGPCCRYDEHNSRRAACRTGGRTRCSTGHTSTWPKRGLGTRISIDWIVQKLIHYNCVWERLPYVSRSGLSFFFFPLKLPGEIAADFQECCEVELQIYYHHVWCISDASHLASASSKRTSNFKSTIFIKRRRKKKATEIFIG